MIYFKKKNYQGWVVFEIKKCQGDIFLNKKKYKQLGMDGMYGILFFFFGF